MPHFIHNPVIIFPAVRDKAFGAVFDACLRICKIAAAVFSQSIQRAVAEKTVEVFRPFGFVAWEIFAGCVLKKFIIIHRKYLNLMVE